MKLLLICLHTSEFDMQFFHNVIIQIYIFLNHKK